MAGWFCRNRSYSYPMSKKKSEAVGFRTRKVLFIATNLFATTSNLTKLDLFQRPVQLRPFYADEDQPGFVRSQLHGRQPCWCSIKLNCSLSLTNIQLRHRTTLRKASTTLNPDPVKETKDQPGLLHWQAQLFYGSARSERVVF